MPGREHHERLDDARAVRVGLADDSRLHHGGMLDQHRFDLERPDPVARRDDHVVGSADEPEVALLVLDGAVAGEVPAVAERLGVRGVVPPVARHQADRPLGLDRERDVALLACAETRAIVIDHVDVVAGRGLAHRAGPDLQAGEVRYEVDGLGLAVPVVDRGPVRLAPDPDHLGIERLACGDRVTHPGEVEGAELELHERPEERRWRAERRHARLLEHAQAVLGVELAALVPEEHRRAHPPLAEELPPGCLRPAGVADRPVQIALVEVLPEARGDLVTRAHRGVRVQHHLGRRDGAGREVQEQRVVLVRGARVRRRGRRISHQLCVRPEAPVGRLADDDQVLQGRTSIEHLEQLLGPFAIDHGDARLGPRDPVGEIARRAQRGRGHRDHAPLEHAEQHLVPLGNARQHHECALTGRHADGSERVRDAVRRGREIRERQLSAVPAAGVDGHERHLLRGVLRPRVDDVARELVVVGDGQPERATRGLVVGHVRHAPRLRRSPRRCEIPDPRERH